MPSRAAGRLPALAEPIDPGQRQLAERRLLAVLRRHRRRTPLRPDLRVDALITALRAAEPGGAPGHRGRRALELTDPQLRQVVDGMVESAALLRTGHRVRLPDDGPTLDQTMRNRVDALLAALVQGGATPPAAESLASRLGIPAAMLEQLRAAGQLVSVAPRIDYPQQTWLAIAGRLDGLAAADPPSVKVVREELHTTRRHAEAILRRWNRGS